MASPVSSCFLICVPQLHSSRSLSHPSGISGYLQFIPEIHGVPHTMALEVCRWFLCWTLWLDLVMIFCHNGPRVGKSPLKSGIASENSGKWFKNLLFLICGLLEIFHRSFSSQIWLSNTCISEMFMNTQTQAGLLGEHKFYCRRRWMSLSAKNRAGPAHRDHCGVTGEIWGVSF